MPGRRTDGNDYLDASGGGHAGSGASGGAGFGNPQDRIEGGPGPWSHLREPPPVDRYESHTPDQYDTQRYQGGNNPGATPSELGWGAGAADGFRRYRDDPENLDQEL